MTSMFDTKILIIDLTTGKIAKEPIAEALRRKFIGGRGLNDWLLCSNVKPGKTEPLSPCNSIWRRVASGN